MKMMSELPRCTSVVELLDWFEKPDHIIMVLEWPSPVWTSVKSLSFTTFVCLKHRLETSCCRWFRRLVTAPLMTERFWLWRLADGHPYEKFFSNFIIDIG